MLGFGRFWTFRFQLIKRWWCIECDCMFLTGYWSCNEIWSLCLSPVSVCLVGMQICWYNKKLLTIFETAKTWQSSEYQCLMKNIFLYFNNLCYLVLKVIGLVFILSSIQNISTTN